MLLLGFNTTPLDARVFPEVKIEYRTTNIERSRDESFLNE
jgi:hypothetical protein